MIMRVMETTCFQHPALSTKALECDIGWMAIMVTTHINAVVTDPIDMGMLDSHIGRFAHCFTRPTDVLMILSVLMMMVRANSFPWGASVMDATVSATYINADRASSICTSSCGNHPTSGDYNGCDH